MEAGFIPVSAGGAGGGGGGVGPPSTAVAPPAHVVRAPGLKRGKMEEAIQDRIKLESVLGLTVGSNAALDCDPNTEVVAYPAGCTVVLYNVRKNRQAHVLNVSRKSITCVAFSPDGRYLATGECGHAPAVRIWDLQDPTTSGAVQIAEFPGHTHGVSCVAFSTSSKYLVSVGSQHDMIVNVWEWRANLKLASNKVSSRVKAVCFSENGNYFVTVGFRHVKFWYLEYSRNAKFKEPVPLMGRSAILGEQKDNEFCDVVCGRGEGADSTYAITRGGLLCEFNSRRLLDKWVELRTTSANCLAIGSNYIFVGCAEGIVRCFAPDTLQYLTTLPRAHYLGVDVAQGTNINHMFSQPGGARFPDAVALTYDDRNHKLTCVYNDHSLYVWDVRDIKRVGKSHSALYHSACIWGVDMSRGDGVEGEGLPSSTFLTCSSDDTVRLWRLQSQPHNIYSNELVKTLYIDPELKFLKDVDLTATSDKDKSKTYDERTGVRCVRLSPDGTHIASGDRAGNIWIHSSSGTLLHTLEAHDAEVLCLEYSSKPRLLASASRDRLIHVFLVDRGYQILQTLDEHSSSITAVRFLNSGGMLQMVSCGADKTILFRQLRTLQDGSYQFQRGQNVSGRTTLYDMEVDAGGRHILTACQDRNVRVYSAAHGRHTKTFRGTTAEDGTLIKVALDNSGIYLATSSTDKILSVYDYYSGECMATMYGHSEIVTGLRFTSDCQHLVSASGDGCVFVWRVPHDMVVTMRARLAQQAYRTGKKVASNGTCGLDSENDSHFGTPPRELEHTGAPIPPDYTLRIGKLPSWANKRLGDELPAAEPPTPEPPARGKWAARIHPAEKRVDSDGSKDSSIDSGTDTRYIEKRRGDNVKQASVLGRAEPRAGARELARTRHHTDDSSLGSLRYEDVESTEHDGDVEDISDGERAPSPPSSSGGRARPVYYPGNNDSDTPGEFMVNAMDAEELRQSVRRSKRWTSNATTLDIPPCAASLSGSQHESDDDEASTPSGDNAERNPLSSSWSSIDTAARRETYLKSAFDSLTTAERDTNTGNTCSLSSQHLSRTPSARPAAAPAPVSGPGLAPSPAPRSKVVDSEAARRRDELNRRIEETRRQLENMAFRPNLKSSQSTTDLSYIPEKDGSRRARPLSMAVPTNRNYAASRHHSSSDREEEPQGMRRAISLSDLAAKPLPAPRTPRAHQAGPKAPAAAAGAGAGAGAGGFSGAGAGGFARPAPRYAAKGNMTRSSSVGVLNQQSDSESDGQRPRGGAGAGAGAARAGLMRPTISSINKMAASSARRRGPAHAYSAVSLSTAAAEESSSSAEGEHQRPRAASIDNRRTGRSGSERDLSAKAREVTARLAAPTRQRPKPPPPPDHAPEPDMSSSQLCSALTEQLTRTASKVVQLYASLQREPNAQADISGLEAAIVETQKVLRGAVGRTLGGEAPSSLSSTDGENRPPPALEGILTKEGIINDSSMSFLEEYSDILLKMMQNKMVAPFNASPQSLPPSQKEGGGDT